MNLYIAKLCYCW